MRRTGRTKPPGLGVVAALVALLVLLVGAPLSATAQDGSDPIIVPIDEPVIPDQVVEDVPPVAAVVQTAPVANADWAPPTTVYIPDTGQTIDGLFLDLWREWGGAGAFGNPISPEFTDAKGHIVQYYGYARFEYWPEGDANGNVVVLAELGKELRPLTVRRSVSTFAGLGAGAMAPVLTETAKAARAWIPLSESIADDAIPDWRYVPETRHSVSGAFKGFWESAGEGYLGNPLTETYDLAGTTYQVFERAQLAWQPEIGVFMMPIGVLVAQKHRVNLAPVVQGNIPTYSEELFIPPPPPPTPVPTGPNAGPLDPNGERWIEINLTTQYMIAWQGAGIANETYVSTGRETFETPTGTYFVNSKIESQTMEGVLGGEYYHVPDVPWVMYFTDRGHAIHGAYWHNNFGVVMSHGCVNLPMDFAAWLYGWASVGTRVEIHY